METIDKTIWTAGHSTRTLDELLTLLGSFEIEVLADIRSFPASRRYPHFNSDNLAVAMPAHGIGYLPMPLLGGRRRRNPDSTNMQWRHPAFRAYADYMETLEFGEGIRLLTDVAARQRTAFTCSEAVWWRCHRSLVSDYLKSTGWRVMHIMDAGKAVEHPYTSAAQIVDGELSYKALL
ncbi:MAG: DUF488 domain-containing protein [Rikenellaceae bacterium]|nr:DUF488 domain-containing protein [Rikenellaceae bacterium]MCL2692391.1 DUF488 domain-containing protein [Rikenellaceae bacterium]